MEAPETSLLLVGADGRSQRRLMWEALRASSTPAQAAIRPATASR